MAAPPYQIQHQQQPQFLRVVDQNGGEIGYIQLPLNQGLPSQIMPTQLMAQGHPGPFVQGQAMPQGISSGAPQGMRGTFTSNPGLQFQPRTQQQQGVIPVPIQQHAMHTQMQQHPHLQVQEQTVQQQTQQQLVQQIQIQHQQQLAQQSMQLQLIGMNPQLMLQGSMGQFQSMNRGAMAFPQLRSAGDNFQQPNAQN